MSTDSAYQKVLSQLLPKSTAPSAAQLKLERHEKRVAFLEQQAMSNHIGAYGGSGGSGSINIVQSPAPGRLPPQRPHTFMEMLRVRMGLSIYQADKFGFSHVDAIAHGDVVHVWCITMAGESVVMQDEIGLFPSDALVTKLRLMQAGG